MYHIIGDKKVFAVEIEILGGKWRNRSSLWLKNFRFGVWDDENLLFPLINSIYRIATMPEEFWLSELDDLGCYELFLKINPNYNDPDSFFELPQIEQNKLMRFDKFIIDWGENFNAWHLNVVHKKGVCIFLSAYNPNGLKGNFNERNSVECFEVPLKNIQDVYNEMKKIIPKNLWPNQIPK